MTYLLPVFKESNFGIVLPKKKKNDYACITDLVFSFLSSSISPLLSSDI